MKHAKRSGWRPFWAALCAVQVFWPSAKTLMPGGFIPPWRVWTAGPPWEAEPLTGRGRTGTECGTPLRWRRRIWSASNKRRNGRGGDGPKYSSFLLVRSAVI